MGLPIYTDDANVLQQLRAFERTHACIVISRPVPLHTQNPFGNMPEPPQFQWWINKSNGCSAHLIRNGYQNPMDPSCRNGFRLRYQLHNTLAPYKTYTTLTEVLKQLESLFDPMVFNPALHTDQPFRMARATYARPLAGCAGQQAIMQDITQNFIERINRLEVLFNQDGRIT